MSAGGSVRSRYVLRGAAQHRRSNHADCRLGTCGIRLSRRSCCSKRCASFVAMNSRLPMGLPRTTTPCWAAGVAQFPVQQSRWLLPSAVPRACFAQMHLDVGVPEGLPYDGKLACCVLEKPFHLCCHGCRHSKPDEGLGRRLARAGLEAKRLTLPERGAFRAIFFPNIIFSYYFHIGFHTFPYFCYIFAYFLSLQKYCKNMGK